MATAPTPAITSTAANLLGTPNPAAPITIKATAAPAPAHAPAPAPAPAAPAGHNSGGALSPVLPKILTHTDIEAISQRVGEFLAKAALGADKADKNKNDATTYREEAAQELFPAMDNILGLDRDSRVTFDATTAKSKHPQYETLRIAVCRAVSARLKDEVVTLKPGRDGIEKAPKFSQRVAKVFSRLVTSYRTGGDGGQTVADKDAREAEKTRKQAYRDMAGALADIIKAHATADAEGFATQVKAAASRWPVKNHANLFPAKKTAAGK